MRRNDSELVDEPAFGGIGLGTRTGFDSSCWTPGIVGGEILAFAFAFAAAGAVTSGMERENKWLTINQNHEPMHMTKQEKRILTLSCMTCKKTVPLVLKVISSRKRTYHDLLCEECKIYLLGNHFDSSNPLPRILSDVLVSTNLSNPREGLQQRTAGRSYFAAHLRWVLFQGLRHERR